MTVGKVAGILFESNMNGLGDWTALGRGTTTAAIHLWKTYSQPDTTRGPKFNLRILRLPQMQGGNKEVYTQSQKPSYGHIPTREDSPPIPAAARPGHLLCFSLPSSYLEMTGHSPSKHSCPS
ncbi:hypothetical protein F1880_004236 [Penicillium rolfsii]|nr:hypothetical protein F1880_004236 [Penicillium rolfsii]